jgi:extracellular factor (EF) 3-hydroxypalmitic acid methyl ester biosynthesis protein
MSHALNGIGHSSNGTGASVARKPPAQPPAVDTGSPTRSQVTFKSRDGSKFNGTPSNFTRFIVAFEIYGGNAELRVSELLDDFQISLQDKVIYAGKAVVHNLVNLGTKTLCEVTLEDSGWRVSLEHFLNDSQALATEFNRLFQDWQKLYKVSPEFKVAVIDLQMFLHNLQLWLDQIELQIRTLPSGQAEAENKILTEIGKITTPLLNKMFEKFEETAHGASPQAHAMQSAFAKRMLHSLLLSSPFLHRTFTKPLGYAGDYEMVNMLARNPLEGGTFFAKIINLWFWEQPPA